LVSGNSQQDVHDDDSGIDDGLYRSAHRQSKKRIVTTIKASLSPGRPGEKRRTGGCEAEKEALAVEPRKRRKREDALFASGQGNLRLA